MNLIIRGLKNSKETSERVLKATIRALPSNEIFGPYKTYKVGLQRNYHSNPYRIVAK